jgi:xanthine dehydrogenase YagR molybdenum-binding subunit
MRVDQAGGQLETAVNQTRLLYAGANRMTAMRLATLDLPEVNAMRAPGEAPGLMALEIAIDEMAEKLGIDPVEFRIVNDTQVDPEKPDRPFSHRDLVGCLKLGAEKFGWKPKRPGSRREGNWLIGNGVAAAFRNNLVFPSGARVRLDREGVITVETDMTDIGTGSYTIIAQTAAEMFGLGIDKVAVQLGDSRFPVSAGSGGQFGANSSTSGVYAACVKLREAIAKKLGFNSEDVAFESGQVRSGNRSVPLGEAAGNDGLTAEDTIQWGDLTKTHQQSTFGAHFVEVGVDVSTGETRIRKMLAVCAAGRILNPITARMHASEATVPRGLMRWSACGGLRGHAEHFSDWLESDWRRWCRSGLGRRSKYRLQVQRSDFVDSRLSRTRCRSRQWRRFQIRRRRTGAHVGTGHQFLIACVFDCRDMRTSVNMDGWKSCSPL